MKNLLSLIGLAVVLVAGVGWYLGWYQLGTTPGASGHREINVDVNAQKIRDDLKKGEQKVEDYLNKGSQRSSSGTPVTVTPTAPPSTGRSIEAVPTGLQVNPDGSFTVTPPKIEIK